MHTKMLNKHKILVITKKHIEPNKKHLTVSVQGWRQTIKIKHNSYRDNTLNLFNAGTKKPVYLNKTGVTSFHYSTDVQSGGFFFFEVSRKIKLNYVFCLKRQ